ncbi:MAG TPA: 3'-5' exonuclease, partial [Dehalococcoidia bacterium]|nr:3'-5' exonuclease [Dehalococcoidia bacterium]
MPQAESLDSSLPFQQTCVALDLETTGLDHTRDAIIEVGAVKFQGDRRIDTFQTFVNPGRAIPEFVQRLTGISPQQVRRAPFFASISADLAAFIGGHPIVGHNIAFDLRFLDSHGLALGNPSYDTWDLASVMLPRSPEYSLGALTNLLGVTHTDPHRALGDAQATQGVFMALLAKAAESDPGLLAYIGGLAARSR